MRIACKVFAVVTLLCIGMTAQTAPEAAKPAAAGDVYHVHFNKAALGKAVELGQRLSQPDTSAAMPAHFIVLRHQEGDDWDYVVIQHLGPKATVDTTPSPLAPAMRDQSAWHSDTFASGPPWPEFARAMGIGDAKSANAVYIVGAFRAAPGHREQVQQMLTQPGQSKVPTGSVVLQHLEGAPWNFVSITRYNSWQDLAADRAAPPNVDGWKQTRDHTASHHDTIADRLAPK
jgi:hypothetical protein